MSPQRRARPGSSLLVGPLYRGSEVTRQVRGLAGPLIKGCLFVVVTVLATRCSAVTIANIGVGASQCYTAQFTDVDRR